MKEKRFKSSEKCAFHIGLISSREDKILKRRTDNKN